MSKSVQPIPKGYNSLTPYITIRGAAKAIEFYQQVFGAEIIRSLKSPDGKIGHAELRIGDSVLMICDEFPDMGCGSPQKIGGTPVMLHFYTENSDAVVDRAVKLGAKIKRPVEDQFYGDRSGGITDPFGHEWWIATHVEDMSEEEMEHRAQEAMSKNAKKKSAA